MKTKSVFVLFLASNIDSLSKKTMTLHRTCFQNCVRSQLLINLCVPVLESIYENSNNLFALVSLKHTALTICWMNDNVSCMCLYVKLLLLLNLTGIIYYFFQGMGYIFSSFGVLYRVGIPI